MILLRYDNYPYKCKHPFKRYINERNVSIIQMLRRIYGFSKANLIVLKWC